MINTKIMLEYLSGLENNNNKEWYLAHKEERKYADLEFEKLFKSIY